MAANMEYQYPSILRRYLATFIDGLLVVGVLISTSYIFPGENRLIVGIRIAVIMFMFFVYEPICTSKFCTLGQQLTGIRIRKQFLHERISIPSAYMRIIVKLFLGIFSFFTIPFTMKKRAIHDFAAGSVVIYEKPVIL
jgi:uncharacterized RDD family membrane protein YckC